MKGEKWSGRKGLKREDSSHLLVGSRPLRMLQVAALSPAKSQELSAIRQGWQQPSNPSSR